MVDFRYHLVSIIAIFLALAVGIVVGTTALNGPIADNLKGSITSLSANKRQLQGDVNDLRSRVGRDDAFTALTAGVVLQRQLVDQRVLLLSTPDASTDVRDAVKRDLLAAGAVLTGELRVRPDLLDPARSSTVDDVVAKVLPAGIALPDGTAAERAGAELAAALVRGAGGEVTAAQSQQVLGGFQGADLIDVESAQVEPGATLVLMLVGSAPSAPPDDQPARIAAALALASALESRAGVVLAGPLTGLDPGGLLGAVRDDGRLSQQISTVDSVDTVRGQVSAVLALHERQKNGVGRYGDGRGASGPAPSPLP